MPKGYSAVHEDFVAMKFMLDTTALRIIHVSKMQSYFVALVAFLTL